MNVLPLIRTFSPEETAGLGEKLGSLLQPGDVICVNGELGAGKTKLAQGVARGLGISGHVTSPSFTLINEYPGRLPFYHMDVYRLGESREIEDLGCEEYFGGRGVTLVEWAERVKEYLPDERLEINIKRSACSEDTREIDIIPLGGRYRKLAEELMAVVCTGD